MVFTLSCGGGGGGYGVGRNPNGPGTASTNSPGRLVGTVTDASTAQPLTDATVTSCGVTATTDSNGNYELPNLPSGQIDITASATGYVSQTSTIQSNQGRVLTQNFALQSSGAPQTSTPTPTIDPTGTITGRIVNGNGNPVPDLEIKFYDTLPQQRNVRAGPLAATVYTDSSGTFVVRLEKGLIYYCTIEGETEVRSFSLDSSAVDVGTITLSFAATSVSPAVAIVGEEVTIAGSSLGSQGRNAKIIILKEDTNTSVEITNVLQWDNSFIKFALPENAPIGDHIAIKLYKNLMYSTPQYMNIPALSVSSITAGIPGEAVVIAGNGFGSAQGNSAVNFNGIPAQILSWNMTQIQCVIPQGALTGQNVNVTVNGATASFANGIPVPSITSVDSGFPGDTITIHGSGFGNTQQSSIVNFDGIAAQIVSWTMTGIQCVVPYGAVAGHDVVVTVNGINARFNNGIPASAVSNISPNSLMYNKAGTELTITGSAFGNTQLTSKILFNGVEINPTITLWSMDTVKFLLPASPPTLDVSVRLRVNGIESNACILHVVPYYYSSKWGEYGQSNGQLASPEGIAIDNAGGYVYIVDTFNQRVQKFTLTGGFVTKWGTMGSGDGQFGTPYYVAIDPTGSTVYVADTVNRRVQRFTSTGGFINKWGSQGTGNGQFEWPAGIDIDISGNLYIADTLNRCVQKFTSAGGFITKWGSFGTGNGQFSYPQGVTVDNGGNVFVSDTINQRIQRFTSTGGFVAKWGGNGTGNGQFSSPFGINSDAAGNVYVTDYYNNRIQKFTSTGGFVTKWGTLGYNDEQFNSPTGIAIDNSGKVYVVDCYNNRIQIFTPAP